jgi:hypothetical protein
MRERAPRALLAALTAALTLSACLGLAVLYYAFRARAFAALDQALEGDFPIEPDDEMGFVPIRNGATFRRHDRAGLAYHMFTSDRRARVNARFERTPPAVDLMVVGCSFSWGHGVESEDTYGQVLARRRGLRVANLAFSAWGTTQAVQMLERTRDLAPRAVVYGFMSDHLKRNLMACAPAYGPLCLPFAHVEFGEDGQPFLARPDTSMFEPNRRFWHSFFFTKSIGPRQVLSAAEVDWTSWRHRHPAPPADEASPARALAYLLRRLHAAAESAGSTLVVVNLPYLERERTPPAPAALLQAVEAIRGRDVALLDLAPVVKEYYRDPSRPSLRFPRDRHPNRDAHRLFASALEAFLDARGLLAGAASPARTSDR